MLKDRVRRTWQNGRMVHPGLIHPAVWVGLWLLWLNFLVVLVLWTLGPGRWWDEHMLAFAWGDVRSRDVWSAFWIVAATFLMFRSLVLFLSIRFDPAPWRPVALALLLAVVGGSMLCVCTVRRGATPVEYVALARRSLERGGSGRMVFALNYRLPGAREHAGRSRAIQIRPVGLWPRCSSMTAGCRTAGAAARFGRRLMG